MIFVVLNFCFVIETYNEEKNITDKTKHPQQKSNTNFLQNHPQKQAKIKQK